MNKDSRNSTNSLGRLLRFLLWYGAAVALLAVWRLPADLGIVAALAFLVILGAYAMSGNYLALTV